MFVLRPSRGRAKQDLSLEEEAGATIGARESNNGTMGGQALDEKAEAEIGGAVGLGPPLSHCTLTAVGA